MMVLLEKNSRSKHSCDVNKVLFINFLHEGNAKLKKDFQPQVYKLVYFNPL